MKKGQRYAAGSRKGIGGRKPVEDKMQYLSIGIRQSVIDKLGGVEQAKTIAVNAVNLAVDSPASQDKGEGQ